MVMMSSYHQGNKKKRGARRRIRTPMQPNVIETSLCACVRACVGVRVCMTYCTLTLFDEFFFLSRRVRKIEPNEKNIDHPPGAKRATAFCFFFYPEDRAVKINPEIKENKNF